MFKGLGNLKDLGSLLKQAQEMGGKMQAINEELKAKRATGQAGGGLVEVEVNGVAEVLSVRIDPSLIEKQDGEMIEDLLPAAFNAAQSKAKQNVRRGRAVAHRRPAHPRTARRTGTIQRQSRRQSRCLAGGGRRNCGKTRCSCWQSRPTSAQWL